MASPSRSWLDAVLLLLVLLCAWAAREACSARALPLAFGVSSKNVQAGDPERWFSRDPDGLYHMRRVARLRAEGGMPASFDAYLNAPTGAILPWPPYYTMVASALADDSGGRLPLEQSMATLPLSFSLVCATLLAAAAWLLGGRIALLVAGWLFAFNYGSIHYSAPGVADHHSWVSLLATALLLLFLLAVRLRVFEQPRRALVVGAFSGTIAGVLLGSWVGAVLYILPLQLTLGLWMWRLRGPRRHGMLLFGLAFHLLALAAVGPAILSSPWRADYPWMVVNLSDFHAWWLALGAFICVLPLLLRGEHARRFYVPGVLLFGGLVAALIFALDLGPAAGLREAFAWSSRADQFMASIAESAPLWGHDPYHSGGFGRWIGYGLLLAPLAWGRLLRWWWQEHQEAFLPLLIALPPLLLQALVQRRFAEPLAAPLALMLGWWVALEWSRRDGWWPRRSTLRYATLAAALLLLPAPTILHAYDSLDAPAFDAGAAAERECLNWLREADPDRRPVLAGWDFGHAIAWVADHPSVACNFGSYVGLESYRAPARFFLSEDATAAEAILQQREVGWVFISARYPDLLPSLLRSLDQPVAPQLAAVADGKGRQFTPAFFRSLGAQVFNLGDADGPHGPAAPLPFLRLAYVSPVPIEVPAQLGGVTSACRLWQVVAGARVEIAADPGAIVRLELPFVFKDADGTIFLRGLWADEATADGQGLAHFRVPYATDHNPGAEVQGAHWQVDGGATHPLRIPEAAVLAGEVLRP